MEYEIVELKETRVAGFTARTCNSSPDMGAVIGGLWQKFFSEGGYGSLPDKVNGKAMGIYTDYSDAEKGEYTVMTGCAISGEAPEGFEVRTMPSGRYAKFVVTGNMVAAVSEFWQKLWQMSLDRTFVFDFEEYQNSDPENCEIHIYIGIK